MNDDGCTVKRWGWSLSHSHKAQFSGHCGLTVVPSATVPLWFSATVASLLLSAHYKFQPMANRNALQLLQIECNKQQPIVWLTTYIYSDLDKHIDLEFIFLIV